MADRILREYGRVQIRIKCPRQTSSTSQLGYEPARLFPKFLWTRWMALFGANRSLSKGVPAGRVHTHIFILVKSSLGRSQDHSLVTGLRTEIEDQGAVYSSG